MNYRINTDKPYRVRLHTENSHHHTWAAMLKELEKSGEAGVSDSELEAIASRHGEGNNKGNTAYFKYVVKNEWLVTC